MEILAHDVDGHEMIPSHLLGEAFGEPGEMLGELFAVADKLRPDPSATNMHQPDVRDTIPVDPDSIWKIKGPSAPSAIDMGRRLEVLDAMGLDRQLVYPTTAIAAMMIGGLTDYAFDARFGGDTSMFKGISRPEFADRYVEAYNQWAIDNQGISDRIRMVGILKTRDSAQDMIDAATKLIDSGIRAVFLQADSPPGGVSPAHSSLDPLWALFEANDVAVTLHLGTEFFFLDPRWALAETFQDLFQSPEIPNTNIQMFSTCHMAAENYLSTLVLGGVFERSPKLRVGLLEVGAYWVGPAARRMDLYTKVFPGAAAAKFPLKPSEYIARNVRVSPFNFEPVDEYFRDYPNLADVFCFSSDFPHVEGIKDALQTMLNKVEPLGKEYVEKFFRTNAELLVP